MPVEEVIIDVPDEYAGGIISDLKKVLGLNPDVLKVKILTFEYPAALVVGVNTVGIGIDCLGILIELIILVGLPAERLSFNDIVHKKVLILAYILNTAVRLRFKIAVEEVCSHTC